MNTGYIIAAVFLAVWIGLQIAEYVIDRRRRK